MKIVVVEDERIVARDLQATLQRAGYAVPGLAASGEEAVAVAEKLKPDLVLMDIVLQGEMDGIAAASRIRQTLGIPIIYLSSYGDPQVLQRAKETEPIGYVLKPFEEKDLLTTIEVVLHQYQSQRQRAAAALLASEARFRTIFEASVWGMALVSREGRVIEANPSFHQILGYQPGELHHKRLAELLHPDFQAMESNLSRELFEGGRDHYRLEKQDRRKDGQMVWVRSSVCRFPGPEGAEGAQFVLRMTEDISQEKLLHDQVRRAQRMETIGTLTSGLAHNLKNILTPVMLGVEILRPVCRGAEDLKVLETMEASLERGDGILKQLLSFGRGAERRVIPIQPGALVGELAGLTRELFPKTIAVKSRVAPGLRNVNGDPNELHQAFLNLCANARDAMPKGGILSLEADLSEVEPPQAQLHPGTAPGTFVVIQISDTGTGMSRDLLDKIFDPFFTTKPPGAGTGLGLSTTLSIIRAHAGFMEVESEPAHGSRFRVYLPVGKMT